MRWLLAASVMVAGCFTAGNGSDVCTPGAQQPCSCGAGAQGIQVCANDGSGFSVCVSCGTVDMSVPANADLSTNAMRDSSVADQGTLDLAMPDQSMPDLAMQDLAMPDQSMPDFAMPDLVPPVDLATPPAVLLFVLPFPNEINPPRFMVQSALQNTGAFSVVDLIDTGGVPTLLTLQKYKAVLTWNEVMPGDPTALGNAFASYVAGGGGLVQTSYNLLTGYHLTGNFGPGYDCILPGGNGPNFISPAPFPIDPNSPLVAGFNGNFQTAADVCAGTVNNNIGAVSVWDWQSNPVYPFIVRCAPGGHRRVDINMIPGTNYSQGAPDFGTIYKDALLYVIQ